MGVSRTPAELGRKFNRAAVAVRTAEMVAVNTGAEVASEVLKREADRSIRGPVLAGVPWGTRVSPATSAVNARALVSYAGPVHWFERGTGAHTIVSRKVGGSRTTRGDFDIGPGMFDGREQGAIRTPRGWRAYANPRGMRPRPFWGRAKTAAVQPTARAVHASLLQAPLRAVF